MRFLFLTLFFYSVLNAESGLLDIKWPTPNAEHQKPAAPYPTVLTEGIKKVKLPVYIPNSYAYDNNMIVVSDNNFYTITFTLQDANIIISGDGTYQESVSATNPEFKAIMKASPPVEFIQAEGIMSAEFNRHGANYSIAIECDKPKTDKRCTETTFIQNLYNRLIMVGGEA